MLIQKIQRQSQYVVMKPPSGGPTTGPISAGTVSQARAPTSSDFLTDRRITSRPTGTIIAPPIPWTTRQSTSSPMVSDSPQKIELTVKMTSAADPMIELDPLPGSEVSGAEVTLRARVTGAAGGDVLRWLQDGSVTTEVAIAGTDFQHEIVVATPGQTRWRAEVWDAGGAPRSITSHVWVTTTGSADEGCGCRLGPARGAGAWLVVLLLGLCSRRRFR